MWVGWRRLSTESAGVWEKRLWLTGLIWVVDFTTHLMQGRRAVLTSCRSVQCWRPCGQWPWPDVTPPRWRWAPLVGCAREGQLQVGCDDVFTVRHLGTSPTISSHPPTSLLGFVLYCLRSTNRHQLIVPRCRLNTHVRPSIADLTVWSDQLKDPVLRAQLTGGLSLPEGDFFQLLFNFFELILRSGEIGLIVGRLGSVRASWVV